jgi:hypothetical protein
MKTYAEGAAVVPVSKPALTVSKGFKMPGLNPKTLNFEPETLN